MGEFSFVSGKIYLFDFEDSFTFNIAAEIEALNLKNISLKVLTYTNLYPGEVEKILSEVKRDLPLLCVYGPGPGTPLDYKRCFPGIQMLLRRAKSFHVGVCLGHQILWTMKGAKIERAKTVIHGQSVLFTIPKWSSIFPRSAFNKVTKVQRYNSLVVSLPPSLLKDKNNAFAFVSGECMAGMGRKILSYQFHPESVGTECPQLFFSFIKRFFAHFLYRNDTLIEKQQ